MCLAVPGKIKKIEGIKAFFDYEKKEYEADVSLVQNPKVGDWIMMHDGRALSKISDDEAKENLEFIKTHREMAQDN
jgi:hydrogenase expression/formation protein HypC